jgi:hypothetical protein
MEGIILGIVVEVVRNKEDAFSTAMPSNLL